MKCKRTTILTLAALLLAGCGGAKAPDPAPGKSAPATFEDQEPACIQPIYAKTSKGVDVRLGDKSISFVYSEKLSETSYNYTRREVFLKGEGEMEGAMLDASCYSETDCDAPKDADGNQLWCLVSHTNVSGRSLRPLFIGHNLCPPPVEVIEQLVIRTASPSCFRAGLATSLGAVGTSLETMAVADEMPDELATRLFKMGEDAGAEPKDAMAILQEMRVLIEPYLDKKSGWTVELAIEQAEAALKGRYPLTLVGPTNVFYDVGPPTPEGWGPIKPIAAPWDGTVK